MAKSQAAPEAKLRTRRLIPDRYDTKWWGWGAADKRLEPPAAALAELRERLGVEADRALEPPPIGDIALPPPSSLPRAVVDAVGEAGVLDGAEDRVRHAAGSSYPDLVRLRSGRLEDAPDAVLLPDSAERVAAILAACAAERVAVVPFGGGTSVVGGVEPVRGAHERLVSLDLGRLGQAAVNRRSLTARLGPGLRGPEAESLLGDEGVTLGHFPQSYEYATIGGFAATRSAGQASSGYGRFDDLVTAIEMISPAGRLSTLETPHTAAGPSLRELIVGSEGALGVITDVMVRVRPAPEHRRHEGWMAASFADGAEIVRTLAQSDALPDVIRLSDEEETRVSLSMSGTEGLASRALDAYLRIRRRAGGCLMITGWEGERDSVRRRRKLAAQTLRRGGAVPLGTAAGRSWDRGRFDGPYLRDELIGAGVLAETLETSHTWSRLDELYRAVGGAIGSSLEGQGTPGIVMCHLSHAYPDGASLYYTFLARAKPGEEIEQWRAVKTAACEAIVATGGTITHHHAVGRDHAPYMPAEVGELGVEVLRAIKGRLDPAGIMNPGKLI